MRVEVLPGQVGFFNHARRREGDVFTIPDQPRKQDGTPVAFSSRWMKPVSADTAEKVSTAQEALSKRAGEIKMEKAGQYASDRAALGLPAAPGGDNVI